MSEGTESGELQGIVENSDVSFIKFFEYGLKAPYKSQGVVHLPRAIFLVVTMDVDIGEGGFKLTEHGDGHVANGVDVETAASWKHLDFLRKRRVKSKKGLVMIDTKVVKLGGPSKNLQ